jgi:hypothetical protein
MKSFVLIPMLLIGGGSLLAQGVQISGGLDTRYTRTSPGGGAGEVSLEGLFLNLRKVWSDETGDRWIGVAQVDFDDNFERIQPYQIYLQYKGPLGKWNVRAGHFLLPIGLLATYDTERLVLQALERLSLGIRHDTGAEVFGRFGDWDYAVAVTDGLGTERLFDSRANPVLTARTAYVQDDWQVGLSALLGRVLINEREFGEEGIVAERRLSLDLTKSLGAWTVRGEVIFGSDDEQVVVGGVLLMDYAITPKLELNSRSAWWHKDGDRQFVGLGISYQLAHGVFLRLADNYEFGKHERNQLTAQAYFEFSRRF